MGLCNDKRRVIVLTYISNQTILMKLHLFSFLFLFCFITLNAQETNERILFTGGILLDQYRLHESYTQIGVSDRTTSRFLNFGVPSTSIYDEERTRGLVSLGLKKFNAKGHAIAFNIFGGQNIWSRKRLELIETDNFQEWDFTEIRIPVYIGEVKQNSFGVNATKSYCVTKEDSRFKVYAGARGEGMYTLANYSAELEGEFAVKHQKVEFHAVFVPEAIYFFPGDKFAMSMNVHLPVIGGDWNKEEIFNPSLSEEQRNESYSALDVMNIAKYRLEIGFSWIL